MDEGGGADADMDLGASVIFLRPAQIPSLQGRSGQEAHFHVVVGSRVSRVR